MNDYFFVGQMDLLESLKASPQKKLLLSLNSSTDWHYCIYSNSLPKYTIQFWQDTLICVLIVLRWTRKLLSALSHVVGTINKESKRVYLWYQNSS
jgi:hypothetical protein